MANFELEIRLYVDGYQIVGREENVQLIMNDGQVFIGDIEKISLDHILFQSKWFPQGLQIQYGDIEQIRLLNIMETSEELTR